ncbi:endothelin-converting enzyme [Trichonephila clavipes]|nr:endothelin-converting enzyme [Trichonephila clavipes]
MLTHHIVIFLRCIAKHNLTFLKNTIGGLRDLNYEFTGSEGQKITIPADERRDDEELYHKKTISELQELAPVINWTQYFNSAFKQVDREISASQNSLSTPRNSSGKCPRLVTQYFSTSEGKM